MSCVLTEENPVFINCPGSVNGKQRMWPHNTFPANQQQGGFFSLPAVLHHDSAEALIVSVIILPTWY